ncbi:MAG: methylated-DNA--[protein]-cysteine S-methyltransferase [Betaproteobacteria bacterium]|nr:methylated-DNA--[protein]-cysteine S-methyltransferase [Betaproteobacteria bacterium]
MARMNTATLQSHHQQRVLAACQYLDAHCAERVTLAVLGRRVNLSPFHLQRLFKAVVGVSPREYQEAQRIARFKHHVGSGRSVTQAMLDAGFGSTSRLYEKSAQLGMTPARYRNKGAGVAIGFTTFRSTLGAVLVAATARGICTVSLGARAGDLVAALRAEFSAAAVKRDDHGLRDYVKAIAAYLAGDNIDLALPLDIRATAFQRKVWKLLQTIPYGETRSYSELARKAGNPNAVRAVARAIATNPVALLIPCHRAIRKGGELAGYRWGIERKAELLKREKR